MKDVEKMAYLQAIIETYDKGTKFDQTSNGIAVSISSSLYDLSFFVDIIIALLSSYRGIEGQQIDKKVIEELGDLSAYIDECFDCDGRIGFNFQFVPETIFLDRIEEFLLQLKNILRDLLNSFKFGKNKLDTLCAFFSLFKDMPCPQDIALIIISLKLYLNRLLTLALDVKLDWFSIVGPILQSLANLINQLFDMIIALIEAPIDCTLNNLTVNLLIAQQQDPSLITPPDKVLSKDQNLLNDQDRIILEENTGTASKDVTKESTKSDVKSKTKVNVKSSGTAVPDIFDDNLVFEVRETEYQGILRGGELNFSLDVKLEDLIGLDDDKNGLLDMSLPEQIISIITEMRKYLSALKASIQENMQVFLQLANANKILEIKRFMVAGVVIDIISLLVFILKNKIKLSDLPDLCSNPIHQKQLQTLVSEFTGIEGTLTYGSEYTTLNYLDEYGSTQNIVINSCVAAEKLADDAVQTLQNILNGKR